MRRSRFHDDVPLRTGLPRRARTAPGTTKLYAPSELGVCPRPMSGMRRAQLMDVYLRMLEMAFGFGSPGTVRRERACRLVSILHRRLGRG